nr:ABC transporter ATP-binding protein [Pseudonocardia acidicola]
MVNFRRSAAHAESFWALRDVSFELEPATTLALIGHNGSGKSTLLGLIGGILAPTSGTVERRGRLAALLELGAGFHGDLTGRENVYLNASILGLTRAQTDHYFDEIVDFSGVEDFIDTQVKFYSSGMYVRLAFAVAVHVDPEIMLIDEVLAVGDEPFQRKCLERIKRFQQEGRTIVLVTHGLDQVHQLCDRAIVLDHGRMVIDGAPVQAVRVLRDRYAEAEELADAHAGVVPPVSITGVRVLDASGAPLQAVDSGGTVVLEIDVESRSRCADWVVGIALQNHMDLLIYGTNSRLLGHRLPPLHGRATARFVLPSVPLVDGRYYVTAAVHPPVGPEWHRLDRTAVFRVDSEGVEDGVLHVDPKFEVVEQ